MRMRQDLDTITQPLKKKKKKNLIQLTSLALAVVQSQRNMKE